MRHHEMVFWRRWEGRLEPVSLQRIGRFHNNTAGFQSPDNTFYVFGVQRRASGLIYEIVSWVFPVGPDGYRRGAAFTAYTKPPGSFLQNGRLIGYSLHAPIEMADCLALVRAVNERCPEAGVAFSPHLEGR